MNSKNKLVGILTLAALFFVVGCNDKTGASSPTCVDIDKISDPVKKANAERKCPRGGPKFKPSPEKNW